MKKENANVILNSFQHPHLNQPLFKAEEILNQVQDDNRRRGFTLIELLVVVLIIGILAAVAVPQYQKAIWKTHFAHLQTVATSLANAQEVYWLANGKYPSSINDLDIQLKWKDSESLKVKEGYVSVFNDHLGIVIFSQYLAAPVSYRGRKECRVLSGGAEYLHQICKQATGSIAYESPEEYTFYVFK